jgi:2-polyprenyl-3-methyl-5-hydroxy-6-metoxy-1,4-benzoquinol methylase
VAELSSDGPVMSSDDPTVTSSKEDIDAFVARFRAPEFVARLSERLEWTESQVVETFEPFLREIDLGLGIARRELGAGQRILEVGAGLGLVSFQLRREGYDVTALEPAGMGFDFFRVAAEEVRRTAANIDLPFLDLEASALDPETHGRFNFIFSVHVMEHVGDLEAAFAAMVSVLRPGGVMVHLCPNYTAPYEPHFSLPLIPLFPKLTGKIVGRRVSEDPVWRSLNFVTYGDLVRIADRHGLSVTFEANQLHDAFQRLGSDPDFASRHRGLVTGIYRMLSATGLLGLLRHVPPRLATPMLVTMRRPG